MKLRRHDADDLVRDAADPETAADGIASAEHPLSTGHN